MTCKVRKTLGPPSRPDLQGPCVIEDEDGKIVATMEGFGSEEQYQLACKIVGEGAMLEEMARALDRIDQWDWNAILQYSECDKEVFDDLKNVEQTLQKYRERTK